MGNKDEKPRSIRFPDQVWDALDDDAVRCKRSPSKQLEAILCSYYHISDVELRDLSETRSLISPYLPIKNCHSITSGKNQPAEKLSSAARKDIKDAVKEAQNIAQQVKAERKQSRRK